jgi:hypothetical protein
MRAQAAKLRDDRGINYIPSGKYSMIEGGVGCVRLSAVDFHGKSAYVLCATSDGLCHAGLPVLLSESQYLAVVPDVRRSGGLRVDINGRIALMPEVVERSPSRIVLVVDDLSVKASAELGQIRATASVAFASGDGSRRSGVERGALSFVTFHPGVPDALDAAVSWLKMYAVQYTNSESPRIYADFDAYAAHFANVDFRLKDVIAGILDRGRLGQVNNQAGRPGIVVNGDYFQSVNNSTIINRSSIAELPAGDDAQGELF